MDPVFFALDNDMRRLAPAHPHIYDDTPLVWPACPMLGRATAVMACNRRFMDIHGRMLWNLRQPAGEPWANLVERQARWFEECHGRRPAPGELHDLEGRHAEAWVLTGFQVMDILGMVSMAATADAEVPVVPPRPTAKPGQPVAGFGPPRLVHTFGGPLSGTVSRSPSGCPPAVGPPDVWNSPFAGGSSRTRSA